MTQKDGITAPVEGPVSRDGTDMPAVSWVDRFPIRAIRPYLRLARMDRPIGTWLLLLPCLWSLFLASDKINWMIPVLFAIGALVMRGAGCTINDIADRNFDGKVARTALRPIPAGEVTVFQAFVFLGLQSAIGLAILLQFNLFSILLGASSLILVALYPFAKRVTYWPQIVLGLTFNWGALMGWAVVKGELSLAPGLLYLAGVLWTLGYDTIYAHQDKEDDVMIGVKSSALRLGGKTKPAVAAFYGVALGLITATGWMTGLSPLFFILMALVGGHFIWQVTTLQIDNSQNCLRRFKSNRDAGLLVALAFLVG